MIGGASAQQLDTANTNIPAANGVRLIATSSPDDIILCFTRTAEISVPGRPAIQLTKPVAAVVIGKETVADLSDLLQQWMLE